MLNPALIARRRRWGGNPLAALIRRSLGYYNPANGDAADAALVNENGGDLDGAVLRWPGGYTVRPAGASYLTLFSGVTITHNYGDGPNAGERSMRVVNTDTNGWTYPQYFVLPAGTYTFAGEYKAASPVSIQIGKSTNLQTIAVTTEWQTFTHTFTSTGSNVLLFFTRYLSSNFDVEIANLRVSGGSEDLGVNKSAPLQFEYWEAANPAPALSTPEWRANAMIARQERVNVDAFSAVWAMNCGPTSPPTTYLWQVSDGGFGPLSVFISGANISLYLNGSPAPEGIPVNLTGDGRTVIGVSISPTGWVLTRNGFPFGFRSVTFTPVPSAFVASAVRSSLPADWAIGAAGIWDEALGASDLALAAKKVSDDVVAGGLSIDDPDIGFFPMGDSISSGFGGATTYATQALDANADVLGVNVSTPGAADLEAAISTWGTHLAASVAIGKKVIVSVMIGVNTAATVIADPEAYYDDLMVTVSAMRDLGFVVIMVDLITSDISASWDSARGDFNALLEANVGTDFEFHCNMYDTTCGTDGESGNVTYFIDGLHPTQTGHDEMYPYFAEVLADAVHCTSNDLLGRTQVNSSGLDYSAAPWTRIRLTPSSGEDGPHVSGSAYKLVASTDNNSHILLAVLNSSLAAGDYYHAFYVKENEYRYLMARLTVDPVGSNMTFAVVIDAQAGAVTGTNTANGIPGVNPDYIISDAGNGWHRVDILWTMPEQYRVDIAYYMTASPSYTSNPVFTGDGVSGINLYGARR